MIRTPIVQRSLSALIVFFLSSLAVGECAYGSAFAATDKAAIHTSGPIALPSSLGTIDQVFQGSSGTPMVYYIQDAHSSLEAQERISDIIHLLVRTQGVKAVLVEGYEGETLSPVLDRLYPLKDPRLRRKVSYFFMDRLRLSGPQYAYVNRDTNFRLVGMEKYSDYLENLDTYAASSGNRERIARDLGAIRAGLEVLKKRTYPKKILEHENLKARFEANTLSLADYVFRIFKLAPSPNLSHEGRGTIGKPSPLMGEGRGEGERYPHLSLVSSYLSKTQLTKQEQEELDQKFKRIDSRVFFDELNRFESDFVAAYLTDPAARETFRFSRYLDLFEKLNALSLTSEEYGELRSLEGDPSAPAGFTVKAARLLSQGLHRPFVLSNEWERLIQPQLRFYELAKRRDENFKRNLIPPLKIRGAAPIIIVAGGFHGEGIGNFLRQEGVSHAVISPRISKSDPLHQTYYDLLVSGRYYGFEKPFLPKEVSLQAAIIQPTQPVQFLRGENVGRLNSVVAQSQDPKMIEVLVKVENILTVVEGMRKDVSKARSLGGGGDDLSPAKKPTFFTGAPYHIALLLRETFKGSAASVDEIRSRTQGRMADGHLSEGTVLRDLGTLSFCRVVTKEKAANGVAQYRLVDLTLEEWQIVQAALKRLGDRPSFILKGSVRAEIGAALPRLAPERRAPDPAKQQDASPEGVEGTLQAIAEETRSEMYPVPLPSLSFFHSALLAVKLRAKGKSAEVFAVHGIPHAFVLSSGFLIDPFPEAFIGRVMNLGTDISLFIRNGVLIIPESDVSAGVYLNRGEVVGAEAVEWGAREVRKEQRYLKEGTPEFDPELTHKFSGLIDYLSNILPPINNDKVPRVVRVSGDFDEIDSKLRLALEDIPDDEMVTLVLTVDYRDGQDHRIIVDDVSLLRERIRQIRNGDFDAEREEYEFLFDFTVFHRQKTIQLSNLSIGKPADSDHFIYLRGNKLGSGFFKRYADILTQYYPGWQVTGLAAEELKDKSFKIMPYLMQKYFSAKRPGDPYKAAEKISFIGEINRALIVAPQYINTLYIGTVPKESIASGSTDGLMPSVRPAGQESNVPGTPLGFDTPGSDIDRLSGQSLGDTPEKLALSEKMDPAQKISGLKRISDQYAGTMSEEDRTFLREVIAKIEAESIERDKEDARRKEYETLLLGLSDLMKTIYGAEDLDSVYKAIVEGGTRLFGFDRAGINLWKQEGSEWTAEVNYQYHQDLKTQPPVSPKGKVITPRSGTLTARTLNNWQARNGKYILIEDYRPNARDNRARPSLEGKKAGITFSISFPLFFGDEIQGNIIFSTVDPDYSFREDDEAILELLVQLLADTMMLKKAEAKIKRAKEKAEAASRHKDELLKHVSHDVRSPLTYLTANAEMLLKRKDLDEAGYRRKMIVIHTAAQHMLDVVNNLLDKTRIEAGEFRVVDRTFDLRKDIGIILSEQETSAETKGLELKMSVPADVPAQIKGDSLVLQRILRNLTTNSLKFTDQGSIAVAVNRLRESEGIVWLRFSVQDTGRGIPGDKQAALFQDFSQVRTSDRINGAGLGLSISKKLVEMLGGQLEVQSQEGKGTVFSFEVPFAQVLESAQLSEEKSPSATGNLQTERAGLVKSVLIVEDDEDAAQLLKMWIKMYRKDIDVTVSHDGGDALERLDLGRFDSVFLDLGAAEPELQKILEKVRRGAPQDPARVILISGRDDIDPDIQRAADGNLKKPWTLSRFRALIMDLDKGAPLKDVDTDGSMPSVRPTDADRLSGQSLGKALGPDVSLLEELVRPVNVWIDSNDLKNFSRAQVDEIYKRAYQNPKKLRVIIYSASAHSKHPLLQLPNIFFTPKNAAQSVGLVPPADARIHFSKKIDPPAGFETVTEDRFRYPDETNGLFGAALLYAQSENKEDFLRVYGLKRIGKFFSLISDAILELVRENESRLVTSRAA